jgi:hypothetical protein
MEIEGDYRERTIDLRRQVTQLNCVEFTLSAGWLVCGCVSASMQSFALLGLTRHSFARAAKRPHLTY